MYFGIQYVTLTYHVSNMITLPKTTSFVTYAA